MQVRVAFVAFEFPVLILVLAAVSSLAITAIGLREFRGDRGC
ncbi:hypothetical protein [Halomarina litorea]|nr:hypothetical protein [Halomarina sp. BCD28]